jgi:hypothetical protein
MGRDSQRPSAELQRSLLIQKRSDSTPNPCSRPPRDRLSIPVCQHGASSATPRSYQASVVRRRRWKVFVQRIDRFAKSPLGQSRHSRYVSSHHALSVCWMVSLTRDVRQLLFLHLRIPRHSDTSLLYYPVHKVLRRTIRRCTPPTPLVMSSLLHSKSLAMSPPPRFPVLQRPPIHSLPRIRLHTQRNATDWTLHF